MTELKNCIPVATGNREAGFIAPILGRRALRDVSGIMLFPLIRAGEIITQEHINTAQSMGKLFELTASTKVIE